MSTSSNWFLPKGYTGLTITNNNGAVYMTDSQFINFPLLLLTKGNLISAIFNDPSECINSIRIYPFSHTTINNTGTLGNKLTLNCGNVSYSDYSCYSVPSVLENLNLAWLGEYYCERYFNNYADYNGYTQFKVWLPYLGYVSIEPNDIMGKYVEFFIAPDIYTGEAVYYIGVNDSSISDTLKDNTHYPFISDFPTISSCRIIANYQVKLGIDIPIGQSNVVKMMSNMCLSGVKILASTAGTAIANSAIPNATSTNTITSNSQTTKTYDIQGRSTRKGSRMKQIKSGSETTESNSTTTSTRSADLTGYGRRQVIENAFNVAGNALTSMSSTSASDRVASGCLIANGPLSIKVIRYLPKIQEVDTNYKKLYGKPLGKVVQLTTLQDSGYTEISNIRLEDSNFNSATDEEKARIRSIFNTGIIL